MVRRVLLPASTFGMLGQLPRLGLHSDNKRRPAARRNMQGTTKPVCGNSAKGRGEGEGSAAGGGGWGEKVKLEHGRPHGQKQSLRRSGYHRRRGKLMAVLLWFAESEPHDQLHLLREV